MTTHPGIGGGHLPGAAELTPNPDTGLRSIRRRDVARRAAGEAERLRATPGHRVGLVARAFDSGCVVLVVRGELGSWAATRLEELADHACARADTELLIELTGLEHCGLDAALTLARIHCEALDRGAHVDLRGPESGLPHHLQRSLRRHLNPLWQHGNGQR